MRRPFRLAWYRLRGLSFDPHRIRFRLASYLTEGWFVPGDEMSQNRKFQLLLGYISNIVANLIGGNFFTGLLLLLHADDSFIGLMSMFAFASNVLQILAPLLLERFERRKRLIMGIRGAVMFINIAVIGLAPFLPGANALRLSIVAVSVLLVNLLNAAYAPGLTVWHIQFTPNHIRPRFFSLISMTNGIIVAAATLCGSALVDAIKSGGNELLGLTVLRGIALLLAAVDLYLLFRMKEYPYPTEAKRASLVDLLVKPFRERRYLKTVIMACMWHLTANIPSSFYSVYLLNSLNVSYSYLTLVSLMNVPVLLFLTPFWRRMLLKVSWFRMLSIAMSLYLLHYVGLAFVTRSTLWLYPIIILWAYIVSVGINLSFTNIPYINIPERSQTIYIGFYSTMANLCALLGATIGRSFIGASEGFAANVAGIAMGNKQALMLVTAGCMAVGVAVVAVLEHGEKRRREAEERASADADAGAASQG